MSEIISKKLLTHSYVSTDLAIIIPTKDRPNEVDRLLKSISELDCKVGRIIIIATGMDIQRMVMSFVNRIPVEYYSSEPGQIKQRNKGISLLDESTKLVATMDDDAVFHKTSVSEMIKFWNSVEPETAGVGFNIINQVGHQHTWLRGLLKVSLPEAGKVLKSGRVTSIINVQNDISSDWLNGGATVWRQTILTKNKHQPIKSRWAVCEDLIFSYPIGKINPLYVCKNAQIEIDIIGFNYEGTRDSIYRGKTQFIWGWYFVAINSDLSMSSYCCYQLVHFLSKTIKGMSNKHKFFWAVGMIQGLILLVHALIYKIDLIKVIEEST
jgi:glycosyltransferase involved in cell wall biosynthesis